MDILAAVVNEAKGPFSLETVQLDAPGAGEALVRILGVGLCHTDLVARDQAMPIRLPAVLGHEGAGVVVAVGSGVTKVAPGDKVVLSFSSCGACPRCEDGDSAYCMTGPALNYAGRRKDGTTTMTRQGQRLSSPFFGQSSFASHVLTGERNMVKVADDLPVELLGPLGCGIQTGAGAVLRSFDCPPGSSLLVTGAGSVGLAAVMAAALRGLSTIIVSDPMASRRDLALELGATHVIDPAAEAVEVAVRRILPDGCDFSLDTTGVGDVMDAAIRAMRPRGVFGLVGVPRDPRSPTPGIGSAVLMLGHTIRGIIEGDSEPDQFIPELLSHYRAGRFPFDRLIRTYPFDAINEAVEDQHHGACIKAVLLLPDTTP
ncbi:NAD(P)-dependent alcohol dehydrogenase [Azospirillum sp. CT11-132]|uniref:NAD(P)-dependent alcohol dehydrogenase n=1 Tax=Azospirillum sp. CT11-132 TaxID=3396317 RepID=UPI0039A5DC62